MHAEEEIKKLVLTMDSYNYNHHHRWRTHAVLSKKNKERSLQDVLTLQFGLSSELHNMEEKEDKSHISLLKAALKVRPGAQCTLQCATWKCGIQIQHNLINNGQPAACCLPGLYGAGCSHPSTYCPSSPSDNQNILNKKMKIV